MALWLRESDIALRAAIYARSSTAQQRRRQTTGAQLDFCRNVAAQQGATVVAELVDEGVSGTVPLQERRAGGRIFELVSSRAIDVVFVFRFDRIARSGSDLVATYAALSDAGIELRSATEPSNPAEADLLALGKFAQRELRAVADRLSAGRDRVARAGRWTNGPIPFGYDLDDLGHLTPSGRLVAGRPEAEVARSVFERLAAGSSTVAEARRLDDLGVPAARRYAGGVVVLAGGRWLPSRINQMIRNPVYRGLHVFRSRLGVIERVVPALIEDTVWQGAQATLANNRARSNHPPRDYILAGLLHCADCGCGYSGTAVSSLNWRDHYYRCTGRSSAVNPRATERCRSKTLPADLLEARIWEGCRRLDPALAAADGKDRREAIRRLVARIKVATIQREGGREAVVTIFYANGMVGAELIKRRPRSAR